jgi:hypothetical protein
LVLLGVAELFGAGHLVGIEYRAVLFAGAGLAVDDLIDVGGFDVVGQFREDVARNTEVQGVAVQIVVRNDTLSIVVGVREIALYM